MKTSGVKVVQHLRNVPLPFCQEADVNIDNGALMWISHLAIRRFQLLCDNPKIHSTVAFVMFAELGYTFLCFDWFNPSPTATEQ